LKNLTGGRQSGKPSTKKIEVPGERTAHLGEKNSSVKKKR